MNRLINKYNKLMHGLGIPAHHPQHCDSSDAELIPFHQVVVALLVSSTSARLATPTPLLLTD